MAAKPAYPPILARTFNYEINNKKPSIADQKVAAVESIREQQVISEVQNEAESEPDEEEDEDDPCFGLDSEEDEEEEEEEALPEEMPIFRNRPSSIKDAGFIEEPSKKFRRHHFIKHEICIPDKTHKVKPVPKGRPWYLAEKKGALEKRQDSSIAFVMPRQEDPEVLALRKTNKMVQKLIKYMKKSWKIRIDRKQADRELEHRTLASVYTKKPPDWMDRIKKREERSLETGFFSAMDISYNALIDLELDTALLTFRNLPPDLKITAGRWIQSKLRKEELKRKRDAYLPRLPHGKVKRPSYNKGRLIKDPGGVAKVDQFVKVAERFARDTKGSTTYSKVLKAWSQRREKESYGLNSAFGAVEGMFDFSGRGQHSSHFNKDDDNEFQNNNSDQRRVSIVDARKYQRDMLQFEKMLAALFDIIKSLLNIKIKQLESKFPLPTSAVHQIRAKSPDRNTSRVRTTPLLVLQRHAKRVSRVGSIVSLTSHLSKGSKKSLQTPPSSEDANQNHNPGHLASHGKVLSKQSLTRSHKPVNIRSSLAQMGNKRKSDVSAIRKLLSAAHPEDIDVKDIVNISPPRASKLIVQAIKKQHSYEDLIDIKSRTQTMLTAEQKIKRLAENPEHAAIRRARNYMTYTKLFERNRKIKRPVWHNIDINEVAAEFSNRGLAGKDPANLTEADATEVVEMALKKRRSMGRKGNDEEEVNRRWPEEYDIPTPTYQFPDSKVKISSEEQSRLDLLKKTPHMDEVPSTPVRRLFKLAGVRTTEKDIFTNIMEMKKMFRLTENKLRLYYENEIGKLDWDTLKRFRGKLNGIKPSPVFQYTISMMRLHHEHENLQTPTKEDEDDNSISEEEEQRKLKQKRPALWFKTLQEQCEINGAARHDGCQTELKKLLKYCDVDMKTKPHMLNRLALLAVSLPTTELGTKHWQQAVVFLLEFMCGTPPEMIHIWLKYRGLPYLL